MASRSLVIDDLHVRYGDTEAVRGLSLSAKKGEIVGFVGPNGSGKSSTIKSALGFVPDYTGSIRLFGEDVRGKTAYKARIGYVPEAPRLYEMLTGSEYLRLCATLYGADPRAHRRSAETLAESFRLANRLDEPVFDYSKGMRQKLVLIAALCHDPDLLFLDEPLDGLDPESIDILRRILVTLAGRGVTVFYSSHLLELVEAISTRVIIVSAGAMVAEGSMNQLKQRLGADGDLSSLFRALTGELDPEKEAERFVATFAGRS